MQHSMNKMSWLRQLLWIALFKIIFLYKEENKVWGFIWFFFLKKAILLIKFRAILIKMGDSEFMCYSAEYYQEFILKVFDMSLT